MGQMHYFPLALAVLHHPGGVFLLVVVLIQIGVLRYAYMRLGISSSTALFLLLGSLIGSYINIPVAQLPEREVQSGDTVSFFGMHYVVPRWSNGPAP